MAVVLGGTQALSRSLFSQMIPKGKEAEYFGLYEISDKGTQLARASVLRPGAAVHGQLPAGDRVADRLLHCGAWGAAAGECRAGGGGGFGPRMNAHSHE